MGSKVAMQFILVGVYAGAGASMPCKRPFVHAKIAVQLLAPVRLTPGFSVALARKWGFLALPALQLLRAAVQLLRATVFSRRVALGHGIRDQWLLATPALGDTRIMRL